MSKGAVEIMNEKNYLTFGVEENGVITKTYARHDLLQGYWGVDLGIDEE